MALGCSPCMEYYLQQVEKEGITAEEIGAVQAVVISGLIRSADFVLQCQDHGFGITNLQWLHAHIEAQRDYMRNYL